MNPRYDSDPSIYTTSTALYRLFDCDGRLLYVGISARVWKRFEEHAEDKYWFSEVDHHEIEWHAFRDLAEDAESVAIWQERPKYNIVRPLPYKGRSRPGQLLSLHDAIVDFAESLP